MAVSVCLYACMPIRGCLSVYAYGCMPIICVCAYPCMSMRVCLSVYMTIGVFLSVYTYALGSKILEDGLGIPRWCDQPARLSNFNLYVGNQCRCILVINLTSFA